MTARRGILRGLAGLIGGSAVVKAANVNAAAGSGISPMMAGATRAGWRNAPADMSERMSTSNLMEVRLWRQLDQFMRKPKRIKHIRLDQATMLGDLPPHIAASGSWAPWFKAQKAIEWRLNLEDEYESTRTRFRKSIGLEVDDD